MAKSTNCHMKEVLECATATHRRHLADLLQLLEEDFRFPVEERLAGHAATTLPETPFDTKGIWLASGLRPGGMLGMLHDA